ncbi:Alpha/Beta hydrolase protein [Jimgerdemannia flammicorona]|uniref:Alpha/Beta hydrolase protein n=1 Tax=Jimgerdemannia flammicorona TaxID=994334 RepID=A0A433DCY6_9FUNG|nr:Alpha/Beta hydrolase protein [Jimgerdemannia flammicorona]
MSTNEPTVIDEWITSSDGHSIFTKTWKPAGEVRATLVRLFENPTLPSHSLIHGFGEHCARYHHVTSEFAKIGILTHAFDQRGFGETGRKSQSLGVTTGRGIGLSLTTGLPRRWKNVLRDVDEALVRTKQPDIPQYLFGHSMGGMIVLHYAAYGSHRLDLVDGVIASAPLVTVLGGPPAPVVSLLKVVAEVVPSFQIKTDLPPTYISRCEEQVAKYASDPLVHNLAGLKSAKDMLHNGKALLTKKLTCTITQPLLQAHGTDDKINSFDDSKNAFDLYASTDKTWKTYDGCYHERKYLVCRI